MKTIREHIKNRTFSSFYLIYGDEAYLRKLYKQKLKDAILGEDGEMNYNYYEGSGNNLNEIKLIAETVPFFGEHRLIIMENTGLFKNASEFADMLADMAPTTHIVFVETEVDKRNKLYKYVSEHGTASEMKGLDTYNLKLFVASELKNFNKRITERSIIYLLDKVGDDMENLKNEIEKLAAYTCDRDAVTNDDIDAICTEQLTSRIFDMTDAIGAKNSGKALNIFQQLLAQKGSPMMVLTMITRHFNQMMQVQELYSQRMSNAAIADAAGLKPFVVGKYINQAKNFNPITLRTAVECGAEMEEQVKIGNMIDRIAVEFLVVKLTSM